LHFLNCSWLGLINEYQFTLHSFHLQHPSTFSYTERDRYFHSIVSIYNTLQHSVILSEIDIYTP
jgi:hypothetical protein